MSHTRTRIVSLTTLVLAVLTMITITIKHDIQELEDLKEGKIVLFCYIDNEYKIIDADKIVYRSGYGWIFTNGYSKTCEILQPK